MLPLPAYAELHCLSNFSFLRGASHPEELVERAHALGYSALAITDECSLAGVVRAHVAAARVGLKLILGTELQLVNGLKLVLLATDRASYGRMSALITQGRMRTRKGEYRLEASDLEDGLAGCLALLVPGGQPDVAHARFRAQGCPGRGWIAVELVSGSNDAARFAALREFGVQS